MRKSPKFDLDHSIEHGIDFKNRIIRISGKITKNAFSIIDSGLTEMESQDNKSPVIVRINSSGGGIYDAGAIVGRLTASPCDIITEGYGHVMSAATLILACGDKRRISKYAFFMHHEMSVSEDTELRISVLKHEVKQIEVEEDCWAKWMSRFTKKEISFWANLGVGNNAYFVAQDLLGLGVVDEIF